MKSKNHKQQTQTGASNHKIKNMHTHKNKQTNKIKKKHKQQNIITKNKNKENTGFAKRDEEEQTK